MKATLDFLISLGEEAAAVILEFYSRFNPEDVDYKKGKVCATETPSPENAMDCLHEAGVSKPRQDGGVSSTGMFSQGEPVTAADRAANRLIAARLRERFPGDILLTEEEGLERPEGAVEQVAKRSQRAWFVDPIDGTKEFIKKNGEFAIQIGLAEQGNLVAGLLLQPTTGDLWIGARGEGCRHRSSDGVWRLLQMKNPTPDAPLSIAVSRSHPSPLAQRISERLGQVRIFQHGSVGLKLMHIVSGDADFYLNDSNSTKAWDIAAPEALFVEAGGVVTDLRGEPFSYDPARPLHHHGLLASRDPALHQRILALIRELNGKPNRG